MRSGLIAVVLSVCCTIRALSQYPDLARYTISPAGKVSFQYHCNDWESFTGGCNFEKQKMKMEVPPWTIPGGWHSYFMVDGRNSYVCSSPGDLIVNSDLDIRGDGAGPVDVSTAALRRAGKDCDLHGQDWSRVYYAVYSAEYFQHPAEGAVSLGFLHAENKDVCEGGSDCHNTINGGTANVCPFSGDYWPRYNSFVCASWTPNNRATNWGQHYFSNELGPVVWPCTGYLQSDGAKATTGVNLPSSIQYDGYVYVFYHDAGPYAGLNSHNEEGRQEGVKVVRAPLSDALDPHAWRAYYRDSLGDDHWEPSLPAGFTKETMLDYLRVQGPRTTDLMGDEAGNRFGSLRFSVARVRDRDYFIGVESYIDHTDGNTYKTALRFSTDLLHWTDRRLIIDAATDFTTSHMNYPIFLSADGWSNSLVDGDDFYVLGTGSTISNTVYKIRIHLSAQVISSLAVVPRAGAVTTAGSDALLRVTGVTPNPGKGIFRVGYALNGYAILRMNVLDMTGRQLLKGVAVQKGPGSYTEMLDLSGFAGGVYLVELVTGKERKVTRLIRE